MRPVNPGPPPSGVPTPLSSPSKLSPKGEQLKMFMTPNEIKDKYQPLDGDREERADIPGNEGIRGGYDNTAYTNRPRNTRGESNHALNTRAFSSSGSTQYGYNPGSESDSDLWSRKAEESHMSKADYNYAQGGSSYARQQGPQMNTDEIFENPNYPVQYKGEDTGNYEDRENSFIDARVNSHENKVEAYMQDDRSLAQSVASEGVQNPVHLGTQFGSSGKPQIVGGHHRIAAASESRPDDLIPVLHHDSIFQARKDASSGGYKYT